MTPKLLLCWIATLIIVLVLPAIFAPKRFLKASLAFVKNKELVRLTGLFYGVIALIFLSVKMDFTGGWLMIIPIFGWIMALKGLIAIWFPGCAEKKIKKVNKSISVVMWIVDLIVALWIVYVALYII